MTVSAYIHGVGCYIHLYVLGSSVGYRMGVYMFMYCGVVWGIGWVLHVYVLWSSVGYRMGVTCLCIVEWCGV